MTGDQEVAGSTSPSRQHSFVQIDHEIFSTVILLGHKTSTQTNKPLMSMMAILFNGVEPFEQNVKTSSIEDPM